MKLSELRSTADEQLEKGQKARDELEGSRRLMETSEMVRDENYDQMSDAMEVDEDYRPKGDIVAANEAFERAKEEYRAAAEAVQAGEEAVEEINSEKRETIGALEDYIEETKGYRESLQGAADSKFGHTMKPLDDTFAEHIEGAEDLRDELLESLGEGPGERTGAGGSFGAGAEGISAAGSQEGIAENGTETTRESGYSAGEISEEDYIEQVKKQRAEQYRNQVMSDPMTSNPLFSGVRQPEGAGGACLTFGINDESLGKLSYAQGHNTLGWDNDCAITQIANILTMAGIPASEETVVQYVNANRHRMRGNPAESSDPSLNGGMIPSDIRDVLGHFGLPSTVHQQKTGISGKIRNLFGAGGGMEIDEIAEAVESGRGVIMGVNHRILNGWFGDITADHAITVVGTARDIHTHDVQGFYINDTGWPDVAKDGRLERSQTKFVPVWRIRNAYEVPNAAVILTDVVIR